MEALVPLTGRAEVLAAVGDTPYTRTHTGGDHEVTGWRYGPVIAWLAEGPWGPVGCAVGPAGPAYRMVARLRADGLAGATWWQFPPGLAGRVEPAAARVWIDWAFLWTLRPPAAGPAATAPVVRLGEEAYGEVDQLLDAVLPDAGGRPGDPRIRAWHGIRRDRRLVACAADKSRGGVGFLSSIAVRPDAQGRGLGTAITVELTRRLFAEFDSVALAVEDSNPRAAALYRRLGFTGSLSRTTLGFAEPSSGATAAARPS